MAMSQITLQKPSYVPRRAFKQLDSNEISFPSEPRCILIRCLPSPRTTPLSAALKSHVTLSFPSYDKPLHRPPRDGRYRSLGSEPLIPSDILNKPNCNTLVSSPTQRSRRFTLLQFHSTAWSRFVRLDLLQFVLG